MSADLRRRHDGGHRVVFTGLGVLMPGAVGAEALWDAVCDASDSAPSGSLAGFDHGPWLAGKQRRRSAPFTRHAVVAAELAVDSAGRPGLDPVRSGVVTGTVYGAPECLAAQSEVLAASGAKAVLPFLGAMASEDAPAATLCARLGIRGPARSVVASCASGAFALADAADLLRLGRCDLVLAGATQAALPPVLRAAYANLDVVSPSGLSRPFDRRRDGFVLTEGAAFVVLETLEHARGRGAPILAELLGAATTNDAEHVSRPSGAGALECMSAALADAAIGPGDVAHVNAHGTGTRVNDVVEAAAITALFGAPGPPVTSVKGSTGHTFAAAGAIEAVVSVLSIRHGLLPPTARGLEVDDEISVDVVAGEPRPWSPGPVVSNSFGLGGHNAALIIGPP
jgi:3-oxoacyl-[acyl-carrier-protein] synthase II